MYWKGFLMLNLAILIPCKNEEKTIRQVIRDCQKELPQAEIFVGDNNCTDNTKAVAEDCGVTVIPCPISGKGAALKVMIRKVKADKYLFIDGDGTYSARDGKMLLDKMIHTPHCAMAIGDRRKQYFVENQSLFHALGNRLVPYLVAKKCHARSVDVMSGLRIVTRAFLLKYPIQSDDFTVETELTMNLFCSRQPYVTEDISYHDRQKGSRSKICSIKDGRKIIMWILKH
jgi:glycosyltransferase involved in cell wall biosynthesis